MTEDQKKAKTAKAALVAKAKAKAKATLPKEAKAAKPKAKAKGKGPDLARSIEAERQHDEMALERLKEAIETLYPGRSVGYVKRCVSVAMRTG